MGRVVARRWSVAALALLSALGAGCARRDRGRRPLFVTGPVSMAEATGFVARYVEAVHPCDPARLDELVDEHALAVAVVGRLHLRPAQERVTVAGIADQRQGASVLCSWDAAVERYELLRVIEVDGEPRPVLRRIQRSARSHVAMVGYEQLRLGASLDDHQVRIVDARNIGGGDWISASLAAGSSALTSLGPRQGLAVNGQLTRVQGLMGEGKAAEALAELDALPEPIRSAKSLQVWRVGIAEAVSAEAYAAALDQLHAAFPDDPSLAMFEVDGALLRGDHDGALARVDDIDRAIGGDPWQDAIRAEIYLQRGRPGDVDLAAARAEAAVAAAPDLAKGWWARADVAMARQRWTDTLATMDELSRRFGARFDDATLRASPVYAGLVASPEYAAWIAARSR
ncbi:MAG: hypothetical protein H6709_07765 [Kofleriaceae bacterium]|nr:hypothetical protein [Myxococcales bacterium]MCB9571975.1 hypothetical protein [Kofleriaceae bacterium]